MSTRRSLGIAALLFGSGACALVYQVVWLRELRLVFGASSAATAAVLGIFMGGLGLGGLILGRRVDRNPKPLAFYSNLELSIAAFAAFVPFIVLGARAAYLSTGGIVTLGLVGATLLRLALSIVILGLPTFLMGGTLPAAVRAAETNEDLARRNLAVLYGANTLGAVFGAFVSTFWMLEIFGTRNTLWLACAVNVLVALKAREMSRKMPSLPVETGQAETPIGTIEDPSTVRSLFVYVAAGVVGFAFLLMELVWYRMLGSVLGGTTYTFGLILVVALLGIGVGGGLYSFGRGSLRPTVTLFTITCALEALLIGLPFAFGDDIALVAGLLRVLGVFGFPGLVSGWIAVSMIVIFPAALVAGYQFPVLIGLLGEGRTNVGRHIGTAYAWNTAGAIAGSIFGGFVLLPALTAPGCWRLVVGLLVGLAVVGSGLALTRSRRLPSLATTFVICIVAISTITSTGPTAVWRHSAIGAGRAHLIDKEINELRQWESTQRRTLVWEADGLEMGVGLSAATALAFIVNGKNDGNSREDAATQVGSGLISAALHPNPREALVVGLGTGSTVGWLARIPSMEGVDVVELEPAIVEVARRCTPVNADLFANPKVNIILADGREVLLASPKEYDLVVSEPSNPYRAGIASLYTTEFYRVVANRLRPGGIFTQWMQAYEVDTETIRTVISTLSSVFPVIEIWQTNNADLMFLCSLSERGPLNVDELRTRLGEEPYRTAFPRVWGTRDAEGFLSHFVAASPMTRRIADGETRINTDDRMLVEFGFARTVGQKMGFSIEDVRTSAVELGFHRPDVAGETDWGRVDAGRHMMMALLHGGVERAASSSPTVESARRTYQDFVIQDYEHLRTSWSAGEARPHFLYDLAIYASALAADGDPAAKELIRELEPWWPLEAKSIASLYSLSSGDVATAVARLESLFLELRFNPWIYQAFLESALDRAQKLAEDNPEFAQRLLDALSKEFAVFVGNERRLQSLLGIARIVGPAATAEVFHTMEPHPPWEPNILALRFEVYEQTGDPLTEHARDDLSRYMAQMPRSFRQP